MWTRQWIYQDFQSDVLFHLEELSDSSSRKGERLAVPTRISRAIFPTFLQLYWNGNRLYQQYGALTHYCDRTTLYRPMGRCTDEYPPWLADLIQQFFTFMWPCIVTNVFIIKPTRCTNFTNLVWRKTLHVSDSSSVHHEEFIHCTLSNGIRHTSL